MEFKSFQNFKKSVKFNATTYAYGIKQEKNLLLPLQEFFRDTHIKPLPEGYKFDFIGQNKFIELKSRTCKMNAYDTTCISVSKIEYASQHSSEGDFFFVFNYIDGMYYWKYNPEQPLIIGTINNIPHYLIPIKYLTSMLVYNR